MNFTPLTSLNTSQECIQEILKLNAVLANIKERLLDVRIRELKCALSTKDIECIRVEGNHLLFNGGLYDLRSSMRGIPAADQRLTLSFGKGNVLIRFELFLESDEEHQCVETGITIFEDRQMKVKNSSTTDWFSDQKDDDDFETFIEECEKFCGSYIDFVKECIDLMSRARLGLSFG